MIKNVANKRQVCKKDQLAYHIARLPTHENTCNMHEMLD